MSTTLKIFTDGKIYRCGLCEEEFNMMKIDSFGKLFDNPLTHHVDKHDKDIEDETYMVEIVQVFELPPKKLANKEEA